MLNYYMRSSTTTAQEMNKIFDRKIMLLLGTWWRAVGCSATIHTGCLLVRFPIDPLRFFIHLILPAALRPWSRLSL